MPADGTTQSPTFSLDDAKAIVSAPVRPVREAFAYFNDLHGPTTFVYSDEALQHFLFWTSGEHADGALIDLKDFGPLYRITRVDAKRVPA